MKRVLPALALGAVALLLAACPATVSSIRITSPNASAAHVVYEPLVRGKSPQQIREFISKNYPAVKLPYRSSLTEESLYYIVPVCGGRSRWEAGANYAVDYRENIVIHCPG